MGHCKDVFVWLFRVYQKVEYVQSFSMERGTGKKEGGRMKEEKVLREKEARDEKLP